MKTIIRKGIRETMPAEIKRSSAETPEDRRRALRPKDAATLIIYRREGDDISLLMGRRAATHVFYPGAFVFPGGRVERADRFAPAVDSLHPVVEEKLLMMSNRRTDALRARAFAMAALREAYEEMGVLIGEPTSKAPAANHPEWASFLAHGVVPSISRLRFVARAITPPTQPRRFDARFFAVEADAIARSVAVPDKELEAPAWVTLHEARELNLPRITRMVIDEIEPKIRNRREIDPNDEIMLRRMEFGKFRRYVL